MVRLPVLLLPSHFSLLLSPQSRPEHEIPGSLVRTPRLHSVDLHSPWCGSHVSPPPGSTLGPKAMNFPALHSPSLFRLFLLSPPSLLCPLSRSVVSDSFRTPWTVARQAPLSKGFSRQEDWSGLTFPPPGDLPNPGIKPMSPASPALAGEFFTTEPPEKPLSTQLFILNLILIKIPMVISDSKPIDIYFIN